MRTLVFLDLANEELLSSSLEIQKKKTLKDPVFSSHAMF